MWRGWLSPLATKGAGRAIHGSESLGRAIRAESESRVIHSEESVTHAEESANHSERVAQDGAWRTAGNPTPRASGRRCRLRIRTVARTSTSTIYNDLLLLFTEEEGRRSRSGFDL
jgi:hypothetical protein